MKLIDDRFKSNKTSYIAQCALATVGVLVVLMILNTIEDTVSIASLGASSFIAFAMPHQRASRPRLMIGGYVIGTITGSLCFLLSQWSLLTWMPLVQQQQHVIFGSLAVGLAIFLMVVTESEHPPAAGLALGYVINGVDPTTLAVVLLGIISLSLVKTILKPVMRDLT